MKISRDNFAQTFQKRLAELSGMGTARDVRTHITALNEKYAAFGMSFRIESIARGYQL